MTTSSRRRFLAKTGWGAAGAVAWNLAASTRAAGPNERITLGVIGCGGRGTSLAESFAEEKDAAVAYVCDPDRSRVDRAAKAVEAVAKKRPKAVQDLREILRDGSVDAVVVATADHWHGPATILACDAGKHVYVEKPCAHNIREGRLMIEAARRNKRIVQVGMQSRSAPHIMRAMELLREGAIGDVLIAKAWNSQLRDNIGHATPQDPPDGVDYDLWLGPAPYVPFQRNRFQSSWHWWYDFGTGDIGNDGVHEIDIARWGLGVETHPSIIAALGGKYFFDDDQQFPDTQYVSYGYPGDGKIGGKRQLVFEQRIWSPYVQEGHENGNAFYGTKGMMILGKKTGWQLFGPRNKLRESMDSSGMGPPHYRDFLDAIKSGQRPHADIEIGHLSAALSHLGNIATRVGRVIRFDPEKEQIVGDEEANRLVRRTYREGHWAVPKGV